MKIGVLLADELREPLKPHFGCYARMFTELLAGRDYRFQDYAAHEGVLPPQADACQGYLITGSRYSAYDDLPWIAPLEAFIRQVDAAKIPLVGVCFGHQIIAQALGGKVEKAKVGWGLGRHEWRTVHHAPWMTPPADHWSLLAVHQDQVTALPPSATLLAESDFCPHAAFAVGTHIFCVQGHPEFRPTMTRFILDLRRDDTPPEVLREASDSLLLPTHRELCAEWVDRFYQYNNAAKAA